MIRNPTAHDVDLACRKGLFVFMGNRQQIMGAQTHLNGFDVATNPVYTRVPFGSIILQQKGEVKEKIKFTAASKPAKKKGEGEEEE